MWLRKANAGSAPGYTWKRDGDAIEVPDDLALELMERPGGEFTEVPVDEIPVAVEPVPVPVVTPPVDPAAGDSGTGGAPEGENPDAANPDGGDGGEKPPAKTAARTKRAAAKPPPAE
jgi:hypothetical protein